MIDCNALHVAALSVSRDVFVYADVNEHCVCAKESRISRKRTRREDDVPPQSAASNHVFERTLLINTTVQRARTILWLEPLTYILCKASARSYLTGHSASTTSMYDELSPFVCLPSREAAGSGRWDHSAHIRAEAEAATRRVS